MSREANFCSNCGAKCEAAETVDGEVVDSAEAEGAAEADAEVVEEAPVEPETAEETAEETDKE